MHKRYRRIVSLILLGFLIAVVSSCSKKEQPHNKKETPKEATPKTHKITSSDIEQSMVKVEEILKDTKQGKLKGIPFDIFWSEVKKEGQKWAGDKFYVESIRAITVVGFDRHDGLSASWQARIIKCEEIKEPQPSRIRRNDKYTIYRGRRKIITLSEKKITGTTNALVIREDQLPFYGRAFDPEKVKIKAKEAEKIANEHKDFTPTGFENYDYELKPDDPPDDTPVWRIGKKANLKKILDDKKASTDWWNIKVNADTGQIIQ